MTVRRKVSGTMATIAFVAMVASACAAAADEPSAGAQGYDAAATSQGSDADRAAVEAAARDYVEALYLVDPSRIERSVHPDLVKRGFFPGPQGPWLEHMMTYQELHDLAGIWNEDGNVTAASSPWTVTVVEVLDHTATARVTADWGIDHMHLARYNGEWKIIHVLWQDLPASREN